MRKSLISLRKIVLALLAKKRIVVNVVSNNACYKTIGENSMYIKIAENVEVSNVSVNLSDVTETDVFVLDDDECNPFSISKQELDIFATDFDADGQFIENSNYENASSQREVWTARGYENDGGVYGVFVLRNDKLHNIKFV